MRVRPGFVAAVLLTAAPAVSADTPLDAARVEVFHDWREIGPDEVAPQAPVPAYCVGDDGWVLADEEVAAFRAHVFVGFEGRGPFAARARAHDEETGLVLLNVHPQALVGRKCLVLSPGVKPPEAAPLVAGTPVLDDEGRWVGVGVASGSNERLGKLATGEWVGHERRRRATGVAAVDVVLRLLERGREALAKGAPVPPAEPVTVGSPSVFPRALRREAAPPPDALARYEASSEEGLRLELLTPASLDTLARADDGVYEPSGEFFRWGDHAAMWEPEVAVQVAPEFHWTGGSRAAAAVASVLFVPAVLAGGPPITFRATWTSGKERVDYRVERGGAAVPPADAIVACFEGPMNLLPAGHKKPEPRVVRGCRSVALFDPRAFEPGAEVVVVVTLEGGVLRRVPIAPPTLERIAADFEPWRASLGAAAPRAEPPRFRVLPTWEVMKVAVEDGDVFRFFFADGSRIDATRRVEAGVPVLRLPAWRRHAAFKQKNVNPAGWLDVTPEAFVFTPLEPARREKGSLRIPRAGTKITAGDWGIIRLAREDGGWSFLPRFEGEGQSGLTAFPNRSERLPVATWLIESLPPEASSPAGP